ncbi:hypothetical protein STANM309S_03094 [Streptomyces tanashiensis]
MPTDIRTRPGAIPAAASSLSSSSRWDVDAGWATSVSTPPSESASFASRTRSMKARPASRPPASRKESSPPPPARTFRAMPYEGWSAPPRVVHGPDLAVRGEQFGEGGGVGAVLAHPQGQRGDPAQGEPGRERVGAGAEFDRAGPHPAAQRLVGEDGGAAQHVGVPGEVLGGGVHDDVGAAEAAQGAAQDRRGRASCRPGLVTPRARAAARSPGKGRGPARWVLAIVSRTRRRVAGCTAASVSSAGSVAGLSGQTSIPYRSARSDSDRVRRPPYRQRWADHPVAGPQQGVGARR